MKEKTKKWTKERIIGLLLSIMEIGFLTFLLIFVISKGGCYSLGLVAVLITVVLLMVIIWVILMAIVKVIIKKKGSSKKEGVK